MLYVSPDGRLSFRALSIHHPPSEDVPALRSGRRGAAVLSGRHRHCKWRLRPPNEAGRLRTVCSVADIDDRTTDFFNSDLNRPWSAQRRPCKLPVRCSCVTDLHRMTDEGAGRR